MSKPRIMHLVDSGGLYGAERVILNLSNEMSQDGRFEPVIACIVPNCDVPCDLYDVAMDLGLEAVKVPINNALLLRDLPRAALQIKNLQISIIHSHGYKPSVLAYFVRPVAGASIMATCHLWYTPKQGSRRMKAMIRLEKMLYRWYPAIVAVSTPISNILQTSGVKPDRIRVVKNGVAIAKPVLSAAQVAAIRAELALSADEFCIINAGRLTQQKAQHLIVDAAAILASQGVKFRIYIVGDGELRDELTAAIEREQLGDRIRLLGFRQDIASLLAVADAFVLPSLDEGMPMSLLEAAMAEVPIIATPVGDVPTLIRDGDSGLLIPVGSAPALAEAIARLERDRGLGRAVAERAKERIVSEYSSRAMYVQYAKIYGRLVRDPLDVDA